MKFIELSFPEMVPALTSRRVDAVLVVEPGIANAKSAARVLGYPYDAVAPPFLLGCFFATTAYLGQNAQAVTRFVDIISDAGS